MEYPLVSCITTTYKKFQYLYETLDSVFSQDYPNIELIIGDDGSPNFPEQEIRDYIEKNKKSNITNVILIHTEENHGTVWNCSNCREQAHGVYLMGIASDDCFQDHKVVSDVVDFFQRNNADVVVCKRQFVQSKTGKKLVIMPFPRQMRWLNKLDSKALFQKYASFSFLAGANAYYTKQLYEEVGGFNRNYKYIEDVPFFLKLFRLGKRIFVFDRITIQYRYGGGLSTTSFKKNTYIEEMVKDRIRYMKEEIIPYMDNFPWWRKEHMKVRLKRFCLEKDHSVKNTLDLHLRLFLYSPIGTVIQLWHQGIYRVRLLLAERF